MKMSEAIHGFNDGMKALKACAIGIAFSTAMAMRICSVNPQNTVFQRMARRLVDSRNAIARIPTKPISAEKRSIHCSRRCRIFDETRLVGALCGIGRALNSFALPSPPKRGRAYTPRSKFVQNEEAMIKSIDEAVAFVRSKTSIQPQVG